MQQPDNCPDDVWENATREERRCFIEGHNWYYDTCERCGQRKQVPDYLARKRDEQRRYEKKVASLAGGR